MGRVRAQDGLGTKARQLLKALPVPILRSDHYGKIVFANMAAQELFGSDVVGRLAEQLYDSESDFRYNNPKAVKEELMRREDHRLVNISVPVKLKDGTREALCSFRWNVEDNYVDAVIFESATEFRRALLRISESLIRPGRLDDTLTVITAEARRLSMAERSYLKLYDSRRDVLVFKALSSVYPEEEFQESFSSTTRGMTGYVFTEKKVYRSANVFDEPPHLYYTMFPGTISKVVVPLLYSFSLSEVDKSLLVCYGVLSVDGTREDQFGPDTEDILRALASHAAVAIAQATLIQETRSTYDELIRAIRATQDTTLAANMLHDGRNMIRGVVHEVETIIEELSDKPFMKKRQGELEGRLDKMNNLLDTIGELVRALRSPRPTHGEDETSEIVDLEKLARRVASIVPIGDSNVVVEVESSASPFLVYGSQTQLLLMLYNLVVNAVNALKSLSRVGLVRIILADSPNRTGFRRMQVVDNGPGLSKAVLSLLRAAEQYSTTASGGLGVGLLTVREAVKDLNGSLAVDSRLGYGTTFTIDLPGA